MNFFLGLTVGNCGGAERSGIRFVLRRERMEICGTDYKTRIGSIAEKAFAAKTAE